MRAHLVTKIWFGRVLIAGVLSSPAAWPQQASVPNEVAKGFAAITEADLRANLTFVASDALEGRLSLEPGDDAAAQWVASEFAKAGLKPAAAGSYLQPVPLIEFRADRTRSFVGMERGGAGKQWKFPEAYGTFPRDVDLSAEAVFAGFGITAPELRYDDYEGIDAKGKIAIIFDHEPQETDARSIFNGTGNTRYATTRVKVLNAQAHGAVGVLIVAEPNRKHPSNQERMARIGGTTTRATPLPTQAIADDELHTPSAIISDAVAKELLANAGATPGELQASIDRDLKPQSRALPDTKVTIHFRNASTRSGTAYNAVGLLEGSDAELARETILISAHHDHDGKSLDQIWH